MDEREGQAGALMEDWALTLNAGESFKLHPILRGRRAVLFDVGGTLLHPDWPRLARLAAEETGSSLSQEEMRRSLYEVLRGVDALLKSGGEIKINMRRPFWLFQGMYESLGVPPESSTRIIERMAALHAERHLWCGVEPDAESVLSELKAAGLQVAVISNTEDGRVAELLELTELAHHFDFLIDSYVVGHYKPSAKIFHLALERLGIKGGEAVYVGDSYGHDIIGARGAGIEGVLLDPLDFYAAADCTRIRRLGELIGPE